MDIEPYVVKPRTACRLLGCGLTRVYELINSGVLESFMDGRNRKITTRSIRAHFERQLAAHDGKKRDTSKAATRSVAARQAGRQARRSGAA
jgi:excisionase family DNA binding protein